MEEQQHHFNQHLQKAVKKSEKKHAELSRQQAPERCEEELMNGTLAAGVEKDEETRRFIKFVSSTTLLE